MLIYLIFFTDPADGCRCLEICDTPGMALSIKHKLIDDGCHEVLIDIRKTVTSLDEVNQ